MSISLETWRWLVSDAGEAAIACAPEEMSAAAIGKLRKRYDADQVRGIMEIARARDKARAKLDPRWADRLMADIAGVEIASSTLSSVYKGRRFVQVLGDNGRVADLCCGIGADSWGLAANGLGVVGVDIEPARALMYRHNLPGHEAIVGDALDACPTGVEGFHLDPARRSDGKRTLSVDDFLPGPTVWDAIIGRVGTGAIKLNPGVDGYALPSGELEILSEPGGLTQAVLWVGGLAGNCTRRATKLMVDGKSCSVAGEPERPEDSNEIGAYLGTLDPCLERADLVGCVLDTLGVDLVHPGTGLVTGDTLVEHPMVRWYCVLETMAWNVKRVRSALRAFDGGVVEVRTRGGVVNPDQVQRQLRGDGARDDLAVLVYRLGDRVVSVIAQRLDTKTPAGHVGHAGVDGGCDD